MARSDRAAVRAAKIEGSAAGLRDVLVCNPDRYEQLRAEWPELGERLEQLVELVAPPDTPPAPLH